MNRKIKHVLIAAFVALFTVFGMDQASAQSSIHSRRTTVRHHHYRGPGHTRVVVRHRPVRRTRVVVHQRPARRTRVVVRHRPHHRRTVTRTTVYR